MGLFHRSSFWYQRLAADAPLDPDSASYVAALLDFGEKNAFTFNYRNWTGAFHIAGPDTPLVKFTLDKSKKQLEEAAVKDLATMGSETPYPVNMRPPGPFPGPADNHTEVYMPSLDMLKGFHRYHQFEVDGPNNDSTTTEVEKQTLEEPGPHYEFGMGIKGVSNNKDGRFNTESWTGITNPNRKGSTTASGLPLTPGQIKINEAQGLFIPHPLVFVPGNIVSDQFRWPATKTDGDSKDPFAPQLGMRFRLPANRDLSGISDPFARAVNTALRDFGAIPVARGGNVAIYCETQATIRGSQSYATDAWLGPEDKAGSKGAIFTAPVADIASMILWEELQVVHADWRPPGIAAAVGL